MKLPNRAAVAPCQIWQRMKRRDRRAPTINIRQLLRIRPRMRTLLLRLRLQIRIKKHGVRIDTLRLQNVGNRLRRLQEIHSNMLDPAALLRRQQSHHLRRGRLAAQSPHFPPSLRALEQDAQGEEAGDSVRTSDDGAEALDFGGEGGEVFEDVVIVQGKEFGTHG